MHTGRVALIAGGSGNIGSQVARLFVANGMQVILAARNSGGLTAVDDEIRQSGQSSTLVQVDFSDFSMVSELASSVKSRFGGIDIFVSCFGAFHELSPMQDYDIEEVHNTMQSNFFANWYAVKCFDPLLRASKAGRFIFVTSKVAANPEAHPFFGPYVISKVAIETMVSVYATETKHTSLCVNIIRPGHSSISLGSMSTIEEKSYDTVIPDIDKFLELSSADCKVSGLAFDLESL